MESFMKVGLEVAVTSVEPLVTADSVLTVETSAGILVSAADVSSVETSAEPLVADAVLSVETSAGILVAAADVGTAVDTGADAVKVVGPRPDWLALCSASLDLGTVRRASKAESTEDRDVWL